MGACSCWRISESFEHGKGLSALLILVPMAWGDGRVQHSHAGSSSEAQQPCPLPRTPLKPEVAPCHPQPGLCQRCQSPAMLLGRCSVRGQWEPGVTVWGTPCRKGAGCRRMCCGKALGECSMDAVREGQWVPVDLV